MVNGRRLLLVFLFVLMGCAAPSGGLMLNPAEATRLADSKAQSSGYDLRQYDRAPAAYDTSDKSWWVNYRRKTEKYTQFSVHVEDKSKKTWLVLP